MSVMKLITEKRDGTIVCRIEGEANGTQLREVFASLIQSKEKQVVIDSTRLDYIDSFGLTALIDLQMKLKRDGGSVRLCSLNQNVRGLFEMAKLNTLFHIYAELHEALEK